MRTLKSAACLAVVFAVAGCGPQIDLTERPLFSNGVNTITFLMYDAFTGAPITDGTVTANIGGYSLTADHTDATSNSYILSQVPLTIPLANFSAPGHLTMVAQPSGSCSGTLTGPTQQCFSLYQVALYPADAVPSDVTVRAFLSDGGAPVTSGKVVATLTGQSGIGTSYSNQLTGTLTLRPTTIEVDLDSTGTAIIPKASLVLGGTYSVDIFGSTDSTGAYLVPVNDRSFVAGQSFTQLNVFMSPPPQYPVATWANNEAGGTAILPNLVVKFPYPVEYCNYPSANAVPSWGFAVGGDSDLDGVVASPATPGVSVAIQPSTTEYTYTATPLYLTQLDTGDGNTTLRLDRIGVKVKGSSSGCVYIGDVQLRSCTYCLVSPTVHVQNNP